MLRIFILLLFIAIISIGMDWIAGEPGHVVIDWGNYHIETSLLAIIAGIAMVVLVCVVMYALCFALIRSPHTWKRAQMARRQSHGLVALTHAFAALATQDIRSARRHITRAQAYLPHQPLTLMLSAQVAKSEGNDAQARLHLEHMLKTDGTEFIALRGLTENARRQHDDKQALHYAEKALALKPQDIWLITTLIGLYTSAGRSQDALRLIEQSSRKRYVSKSEARKLSGFILYENARLLAEQKRPDFAIAVLEDVLRKSPGFIPASVLLATIYCEQKEIKRAIKILESTWKQSQHPDISHAFLACVEKEHTDHTKTFATIEKIAGTAPQTRESRYLQASLAIKKGDSKMARHITSSLLNEKETARACRLMSEIEMKEGNTEDASVWIKRAHSAISDPAWQCSECSHVNESWHLICPQCGAIATIEA